MKVFVYHGYNLTSSSPLWGSIGGCMRGGGREGKTSLNRGVGRKGVLVTSPDKFPAVSSVVFLGTPYIF